jgi:hypothetical protein
MEIVGVIVGRSIEQPGSPLRSVDRYPGSAIIYLLQDKDHTPIDHDELGTADQ